MKPKGPAVTVFHASNRRENRAIIKVAQIQFFSPYARYLAVLPFAEKERQAETARLAAESRKRKLCPDNSDDVIMVSLYICSQPTIQLNLFLFDSLTDPKSKHIYFGARRRYTCSVEKS